MQYIETITVVETEILEMIGDMPLSEVDGDKIKSIILEKHDKELIEIAKSTGKIKEILVDTYYYNAFVGECDRRKTGRKR
jgi:hypothetical protein